MKKVLILLSFLFSSSILSAQISLDIKDQKISYFRKVEKENKSELFKFTNAISFPKDGVDLPVIYRRKQVGLPDLLVYYYPFKKNAIISEIYYDWNEVNFMQVPETTSKSWAEMKPYIVKYQELLDDITAKYGKSQAVGSLDTSLINKNGLARTDKWKTDAAEISLDIELSNKQIQQGNLYTPPTYFIHLDVLNTYEKKTEQIQDTLTKEKINVLDAKVKLFLADLLASKFKDARKYMSAQSIQFKDDQLNILKGTIKDDKWDLADSGKQLLLPAAKLYNNLRYARQGDTNKPPLELLSVLFDEDDKIILLQPLKRGAAQ